MNSLVLVPAFRRHVRQYLAAEDTDSKLAAYIADGTEALAFRWSRTYAVTLTAPETYNISPDVEAKDKRPIVLMASIIYKAGTLSMAGFKDQDFAYDPQKGRQNPLMVDIEELARFLPIYRLAKAVTSPMRGFNNVLNPESYDWLSGVIGGGLGIQLAPAGV